MRGTHSFLVPLLLLPRFVAAEEISTRITPANPFVADLVHLEVSVKAPRGVPVDLPDTIRADCAQATEARDFKPEIASTGLLYRRTFTLDLAGPGPCRIPPLPVLIGDSTLRTREVVFEVRSMLPPGDGDPVIRDSLDPVPYRSSGANWIVIVAAVFAAALGILLVVWMSRHRSRRVRVTAEAEARRRLAELPASGDRDFYRGLSGVLARYLRQRFRIRANRRTSQEIVDALRRLGVLVPECEADLIVILAECDHARYSRDEGSGRDPAEAVAICRRIIDSLGAQAATTPRLARPWEEEHAAV